ncbi:MAG: DinB family protein, partial [Ilumatobacteraceae bacterium]
MVDLKPPRLVAGEHETLLALLQYQRESLVRKVSGVDEAAARQQYVGSGTSLLWLIKHVAHAETIWVVQRFAGGPVEPDDSSVNPDDTVATAIDAYRQTWVRVESIVSRADLDDTCRALGDDAPVSLRWVLMHLLEETARHAGHADILREL